MTTVPIDERDLAYIDSHVRESREECAAILVRLRGPDRGPRGAGAAALQCSRPVGLVQSPFVSLTATPRDPPVRGTHPIDARSGRRGGHRRVHPRFRW
jgi:hypothetical protein